MVGFVALVHEVLSAQLHPTHVRADRKGFANPLSKEKCRAVTARTFPLPDQLGEGSKDSGYSSIEILAGQRGKTRSDGAVAASLASLGGQTVIREMC